MKNTNKKSLPKFKSEKEEHDFWSTHSITDYLDEFENSNIEIDPKLAHKIRERHRKKHIIAIRLDDNEYSQSQKLALKKGFGLSALIRSWIAQGISRELRLKSG